MSSVRDGRGGGGATYTTWFKSAVHVNVIFSRIFALGSICFLILITGDLFMFGTLAGKRIVQNYYIPLVIMLLIEQCMIVLVVLTMISLWRHWRIAATMVKYGSLRVNHSSKLDADERERYRHFCQLQQALSMEGEGGQAMGTATLGTVGVGTNIIATPIITTTDITGQTTVISTPGEQV